MIKSIGSSVFFTHKWFLILFFHPMKESLRAMTKNSSAMTTSSQRWHRLLMFFFFYATFSLNSVSSSSTQLPNYDDHCSSTVHGSHHNKARLPNFPIARSHNGYYTGGNPVLNPNPNPFVYESTFSNSLLLRTLAVFDTNIPDLFKFEGRLAFQRANKYNCEKDLSCSSHDRSSISFEMEGFWSKSKGKLCMVGSAYAYTEEGNLLTLSAILKLYNLTNSTSITGLITGTLESLSSTNDPAYFGPISMLILPQVNYKYAPVSENGIKGCSGGSESPRGMSLSSLPKGTFCSIASSWAVDKFDLRYASECNSAKSCNPFIAGIGYVPRVVFLHRIVCSEDTERMRVLVEFSNNSYVDYYRSFKPETTLVGEGSWEESKHQLCIVACQFLGFNESFANARVGDCSTRLSFRFPAIWSIKDASNIAGKVWTNKTVKELGYFDRIILRSSRNRVGVPDLKYEYTKINTAMKLCAKSEKPAKANRERYPSGHSDVMRFQISVKNSTGQVAWGNSVPMSIGDQFYYSSSEGFVVPASSSRRGSVNISCSIGLYSTTGFSPFNSTSSTSYEMLEILAEGTYDDETGSMCMVGCRNLGSENQIPRAGSWDCEILVKFHFPPINSKKARYIKGSISSTREKSDPLYFERLDSSSYDFYEDGSSIWSMDVEIIMALISSTLSCVFVVLQIFHVKRHPDVLPFISFFMQSILTFGQLIPLVLNFEALFLRKPRRNMWLESDRWVEANEVIVRTTGMVALLLQFRLLQKIWSTKWSTGNQRGTWVVERKALLVALPLYVTGALIAVAMSWWNEDQDNHDPVMFVASPITYRHHSLWEDLKSYAGLVLDGFLLPQILLNMFWNSRKSALSSSFYIGNTFLRFLPHAYDVYRAHNYAPHYAGTYIYADPSAGFYSTAWDVIIPLGGLAFALIVYLQQRFGGLLGWNLGDEKVPVISDA
ncbi:uncharacterized protein LOC108992726 [Juglans regia]|uniref:RING-type E3 ubiquitin transferase n=2 Tax=Juglans regia TaxID=51240 RepID=A0A2I4EU14_JUGRE|nr:uncharacterized protein LOC108992726 [Juglans regia]